MSVTCALVYGCTTKDNDRMIVSYGEDVKEANNAYRERVEGVKADADKTLMDIKEESKNATSSNDIESVAGNFKERWKKLEQEVEYLEADLNEIDSANQRLFNAALEKASQIQKDESRKEKQRQINNGQTIAAQRMINARTQVKKLREFLVYGNDYLISFDINSGLKNVFENITKLDELQATGKDLFDKLSAISKEGEAVVLESVFK
jgi:hypothetical protein